MALFRKSPPASPDGLTEAEGFAGVALCAMVSDGVIDADEVEDLSRTLAGLAPFRAMGGRDLDGLFQRLHRLAADEGDEALLARSVAAVPERLRPTAFFVAADVLLSDGDLGGEEKAFLERARVALGLDEPLAARILEVAGIKNRA